MRRRGERGHRLLRELRLHAGDTRERGEQRRRQRPLELPVRQAGQPVAERDRLALLRQLQPARRMRGRLGEDRRVRRPAAASCAAAAPVEDRQLDPAPRGERRQRLLRAVDLPLRRQVAAVLAGVRVADHDLQPVAAIPHPRAEARLVEQLLDDRGRSTQIGDRLEERHDRERLVASVERGQRVGRRRSPRHDHRVERPRPVPLANALDRLERAGDPLAAGVEVLRMQPHVELGDVEAEQLDPSPQRRQPAPCDPGAAVRPQARIDERQVGRKLVRRQVAVRLQPPPDKRQLAPVRLALVLSADHDGVVGELPLVVGERVHELRRHADERARHAQLTGQRAHLVAVARHRERARLVQRRLCGLRPGGRVAVLVAADPRAEAERQRRVRQALPVRSKQVRRRFPQALLEEPEPVANLVQHAWALLAHLVGLPQRGDLLGERRLELRLARARQTRVVELRRARPRSARARRGTCAASPPSGAR